MGCTAWCRRGPGSAKRSACRPATCQLRAWLEDLLQPPVSFRKRRPMWMRPSTWSFRAWAARRLPGNRPAAWRIGDRRGEVRLTRQQDVPGASPAGRSPERGPGRTDGPQPTIANAGPVIRRFSASLGDGRVARLLGKDTPSRHCFGTRGEHRAGSSNRGRTFVAPADSRSDSRTLTHSGQD